MSDDDAGRGRLFTRREALSLFGISALHASPSPGASRCIVQPEQTEGPYFVDEALRRADIRNDPVSGVVKRGVPLRITFDVARMTGTDACSPLADARIDLWHCDALGIYSGVREPAFETTGQKFLRGYQITDWRGAARFTTIFPGWYEGRTVHVHFKIRTEPTDALKTPGYEFTSQLYFDDALTDRIHRNAPYAAKGQRTLRNDRDGIFRHGGPQLTLGLTQNAGGYAGTFAVALDPHGRRRRRGQSAFAL